MEIRDLQTSHIYCNQSQKMPPEFYEKLLGVKDEVRIHNYDIKFQ